MKESLVELQIQELMTLKELLKQAASPAKASSIGRFFKKNEPSAPLLLGVYTPQIRKIARAWLHIQEETILSLLQSHIHEERVLAILIWVMRYPKMRQSEKERILDLYLGHLQWLNQWDLVDLSAPYLLGKALPREKKASDKSSFERLSQAKKLLSSDDWFCRRVALVASLSLVREGELTIALEFCEQLALDSHDLIQKAVGWVLREVGKKDLATLESFLEKHAHHLPRTSLRYSLERMPSEKRTYYMKIKNPVS